MRDLARRLKPHHAHAALFLLVRKMTLEKVLAALQGPGGEVLKTSLDSSKEQALRDALQAAGCRRGP